MKIGNEVNATYLVEMEVRQVTPIQIEAENEQRAIELVLTGNGEPGQSWYEETLPPRVRLLDYLEVSDHE